MPTKRLRNYNGPDFNGVREEFFSYTRREGECLIWTGRYEKGKYPVFRFEGRYYRAFNVAWQLADGWLPVGRSIRRRCDDPRCVERSHYWINGLTPRIFDLIKQDGDTPDGFDDRCINWQGHIDSDGYGRFEGQLAHRCVYELKSGAIPEGFDLHHECRNRRCVNVNHLVPLASEEHRREAVRLARAARKIFVSPKQSTGLAVASEDLVDISEVEAVPG